MTMPANADAPIATERRKRKRASGNGNARKAKACQRSRSRSRHQCRGQSSLRKNQKMPAALQQVADGYVAKFGSNEEVMDLRMVGGKLGRLPKRQVVPLGTFLDEKFEDARLDIVLTFLEWIFSDVRATEQDQWEKQILDDARFKFEDPKWVKNLSLAESAAAFSPTDVKEICPATHHVVCATLPVFAGVCFPKQLEGKYDS
ncbi:uncharacterized protein EV422DRAFT_421643 [Fimicolochytrium jonesii]|uniref:uncharacterized protein n=1 Tax=Fimicolochytrium jonesii TaxID=1396493 RepID=UPI0022FE26C6|nr:uncharacterized protein EV422DRAFT_421643 [Fimicolochytrium jonesii]KAI8822217.1 hypothetical protein EV422DRAFT_421643 [Fimicolochytrium jonesii]